MDLTEAIQRFEESKLASRAFGENIRDHVAAWHVTSSGSPATRSPTGSWNTASKPPENLARLRAWPGDADVAVALTFDVDAESAWLGEGPEYERRLTTLSQAGYGPVRGLGRIFDLLDAHGIKSTFDVPGHTADHYPGSVSEILERGHEVGHHGYLHRGTDGLDAASQRAELEQGLEALARLGVRPHATGPRPGSSRRRRSPSSARWASPTRAA